MVIRIGGEGKGSSDGSYSEEGGIIVRDQPIAQGGRAGMEAGGSD